MSCTEPPAERNHLPPDYIISTMQKHIVVVKMSRSAGGQEEIVKIEILQRTVILEIISAPVGDIFAL